MQQQQQPAEADGAGLERQKAQFRFAEAGKRIVEDQRRNDDELQRAGLSVLRLLFSLCGVLVCWWACTIALTNGWMHLMV